MNKVIGIVGPTAIGKTALSIELAKKFPVEIVNADAMQVYKGMDIGTGKVTEKEKQGITHHLLDILFPNDSFSVAQYKKQAEQIIKQTHKQMKIPLLIGGSGLYMQAVLFDYSFLQPERDEQITKLLENRLQNEGNEVLYRELVHIDPVQAEKIHPNNYRRVIRALEIYQSTGLTMSEIHQRQTQKPNYDHFLIGLEMNRDALYERINLRVDQMIEAGLVNEVEELYGQGYEHTQAMKAIGYKELIPYVKGEISLQTATDTLKQNSRRYAKRQLTWFKNKMDIHWYRVDEAVKEASMEQMISDCDSFLKKKGT